MIELLFQVQISHGYFDDGVYQTCSLIADTETEEIFQRYGLVTRMNRGVYGVYSSMDGDTLGLIQYLNDQLEGEPLRLLMVADEEQFTYITELPFDWVGQLMLSSRSGKENGSSKQLTPVLSGREINKQNVIGIISIYLDDLVAPNSCGILYKINFQARSLRWLYYLINRSQTKLYKPAIRGKSHVFDGPESIVLPTGESGLCFTSGEMQFPLQQTPTYLFDLVDRIPTSMNAGEEFIDHCLINGLPTPNEGELSWAKESKDVVSAMYVYL